MNSRNCVCILGLLLIVFSGIKAQVIKVESGVAFSSLKNKDLSLGNITSPQISIGVDYYDKSWFNLSSNIGYIRRGAKDKIITMSIEDPNKNSTINVYQIADYLTLNTTFRAKKRKKNETYYIGIGPRVDFKLNDNASLKDDEIIYSPDIKSTSVIYGLKCELGFNYTINKIVIGANAAYLPNFNKQIKVKDYTGYRGQAFTAGLSIGYIL